jgi:DNA polymerase III subunit delta'
MSFQQVEGQLQVIELLQRSLREDRVAHAYCFAGPEGTGKKKTALAFAQAIHCETKQDDACDRCRTCLQIAREHHPDVYWLRPDGSSIKMEQVRQLQKAFLYRPSEQITRVIVMEQADLLTVQAANSLLKFLEEPVSWMVTILLTEKIDAMLATILSRCQILRFIQLHPAMHDQRLQREGIPAFPAMIWAELPYYSQVIYRQWSEEEFVSFCRRIVAWSEEMICGQSSALIIPTEWLQKETEKQPLSLVLDILLLWWRDLLNYRLQPARREAHFLFAEWKVAREKQANRWDRSRWLWGMEAVLRARAKLAGSMQPQAVLEQMVLAMQEGSLSC